MKQFKEREWKKRFITYHKDEYHKDEGEGDYYTADIIKIEFDNWIKAGMKID